jgi:hypothetical protein
MSHVPPANPDLPSDVQADYAKAARIAARSPRGAAALLRLAIQELMPHLGEKGKDINEDIAALVKKGLSADLQKALDILRVVGNNAVHPAQLSVQDDPDTANSLFDLVNWIAEELLTRPRRIREIYAKLPAGAQQAIEKRDAASST